MKPPEQPSAAPTPQRYGRYVGLLGIVLLGLITLNTLLTKPNGSAGIAPGQPMAPFAVPLATGSRNGDADIATHANDGGAGKVPACSERGTGILNICELYEQGPVVLALFVDEGGCQGVVEQLQGLAGQFPSVRFAAVAIEGNPSHFDALRASLRALVRRERLTIPVGIDGDGVLASLYKVASCPQVNFAYRGGLVQSRALLGSTSTGTLRKRAQELLTAAHRKPA
ncbi:MAG: TlpA family protein disulfide reductase [Solirubrobacteraceae bacterium]